MTIFIWQVEHIRKFSKIFCNLFVKLFHKDYFSFFTISCSASETLSCLYTCSHLTEYTLPFKNGNLISSLPVFVIPWHYCIMLLKEDWENLEVMYWTLSYSLYAKISIHESQLHEILLIKILYLCQNFLILKPKYSLVITNTDIKKYFTNALNINQRVLLNIYLSINHRHVCITQKLLP